MLWRGVNLLQQGLAQVVGQVGGFDAGGCR